MKKIICTILALVMLTSALLCLGSCAPKIEPVGYGASEHYGERETEGKTLRYAIMSVEGYGSIVLLLEESTAPVTVNNFLDLANSGFYDGLTFHRIKSNFMIQGGDPKANGTGGSDKDITGEFLMNGHFNDLYHLRGTISMARGNHPNSASSQFFICNTSSARSSLDYNYAAFGYVMAGMSVVDAITSNTERYGDSSSYTIADKSLQAVISCVREITYEEAMQYVEESRG